MIQPFTHAQETFPPVLKWQALAFMRVVWSGIFTGENAYMHETYPPENSPVHFGLAHKDCLISYAAVLTVEIVHHDIPYTVLGFGNMLTFPPYEKQGYGSQVLRMATEHIQNSGADIGILFCAPRLESFYSKCGWEPSRGTTYIGAVDDQERYDELRMMLYVSEKGRRGREDFEQFPLSISWPW